MVYTLTVYDGPWFWWPRPHFDFIFLQVEAHVLHTHLSSLFWFVEALTISVGSRWRRTPKLYHHTSDVGYLLFLYFSFSLSHDCFTGIASHLHLMIADHNSKRSRTPYFIIGHFDFFFIANPRFWEYLYSILNDLILVASFEVLAASEAKWCRRMRNLWIGILNPNDCVFNRRVWLDWEWETSSSLLLFLSAPLRDTRFLCLDIGKLGCTLLSWRQDMCREFLESRLGWWDLEGSVHHGVCRLLGCSCFLVAGLDWDAEQIVGMCK